jgi:hypothetical protein
MGIDWLPSEGIEATEELILQNAWNVKESKRVALSPQRLFILLFIFYRFLSNKSKPASHVRMFMKIESEYNSEEIKAKLPLELNRLAVRVIELVIFF